MNKVGMKLNPCGEYHLVRNGSKQPIRGVLLALFHVDEDWLLLPIGPENFL
jgi:hypothetical protein